MLVNCSGSAVALTPETETCDAILQAWYAGEQGGTAVADVLFGDYNPGGKLPVTFYKDDSQLPPFDDYSMKGRTYRYFNGEPLFHFGHGLSYTTFQLGKASYDKQAGKITLSVKNTGSREGTEVVQAYVRNTADTRRPHQDAARIQPRRTESRRDEDRDDRLPARELRGMGCRHEHHARGSGQLRADGWHVEHGEGPSENQRNDRLNGA